MDLKIRLPESLDQRLRTHAENTGATLNSIICLAIDAFVPGPDKLEKPIGLEPRPVASEKSAEPEKRVTLTPKQLILPTPKAPLSAKLSKAEEARLHNLEYEKKKSCQRDLLDKT